MSRFEGDKMSFQAEFALSCQYHFGLPYI